MSKNYRYKTNIEWMKDQVNDIEKIISGKSKGLTFKKIKEQNGWSLNKARCLSWYLRVGKLREFKRRIINPKLSDNFDVATANMLWNAGIYTKYKLIQAYNEGRFDPRKANSFRNCGWKKFITISRFLGLPNPRKPQIIKLCPHCGKNIRQP